MQQSLINKDLFFVDRLRAAIKLLLFPILLLRHARLLPVRSVRYAACISVTIFLSANINAQTKKLSLQDCINIAVSNNLSVKTVLLEIEQNKTLEKTSFDPPKTNINLTQDPTSGGNMDNALGITQNISLPGVYKNQKNVLQQQTMLAEKSKSITQAEIVKNVKEAYYDLLYLQEKIKVLKYLDSIYNDFTKKAEIRQRTGETSNLEKLSAQSKYQEIQLQQKEALADKQVRLYSLQQLLNTAESIDVAEDTLTAIAFANAFDTSVVSNNPMVDYYKQAINISNAKINLEKARRLPEFTVGYSQQLVIKGFDPAKIHRDYFNGTSIAGFQIGVSFPLIGRAYKEKINAEKIGLTVAQTQAAATQQKLKTQWQQALQEYLKYKQSLDYYQSSGLQLANEQMRVAQFSFSKGEIGYVEFIQNLSLATQTKLDYLSTINLFNDAVINLQYLQGNNQ